MKTQMLLLVAGAALSMGATAFAATDTLSRDEVRAIVREVMADAETRTSMQGGAGAAYNDGFVMGNGDFTLKLNAYTKFRYSVNFRSKSAITGAPAPANVGGRNNVESGFSNRQTSVTLSGTAANPNLGYNFRFTSANDAGTWINDDAFITAKLGEGWMVTAGQFKLPLLREELVSDINSLFADRGVVNAFFTGNRSQGAMLSYTQDSWDAHVMLSDGLRAANTATTAAVESSYAITGRVNVRLMGNGKALADFTSNPNETDPSLMVGGAIHWQQASQNPANLTGRDVILYTVDAQFEQAGFNLFAAFVGSNTKNNTAAGPSPQGNAFGFNAQGGYRWNQNDELFVRYDGLFLNKTLGTVVPGGGATVSPKNYHFISFGYNRYIFGTQNARFTLDAIIALTRTVGSGAGDTGLLGGPGGSLAAVIGGNVNGNGLIGQNKSGEVLIRAQFQLAF